MAVFKKLYKTVESAPLSCFAGANTPDGFVSDWGELLRESSLHKLYIIKGAPGTGKSTLIKRCADNARQAGAAVYPIFCSSDPDSLDGVIIEKNSIRVALADGTAPHVLDPQYPGACGEIVNCGDLWHTRGLEAAGEDIAQLTDSKALCYRRAYNYLHAAGSVADSLCAEGEKACLTNKMEKFITRVLASMPAEKASPLTAHRRTHALSMKGALRLSSFEGAPLLIGVEDCACISPFFFSRLSEALKKACRSQIISVSPLGHIAEIYLPRAGVAFVPLREGVEYSKIVRLKRFANGSALSEHSCRRRFGEKCAASLLDGALEALAEAGDFHAQLETIYSSQMDFDKANQLAHTLSDRILSRLG